MSSSRRIAYVVAEFPSISETFILRELLALRRRGQEVVILALNVGWPRKAHPEAESLRSAVVYAGAVSAVTRLYQCLRLCFRAPGKMRKILRLAFRYLSEDVVEGLRLMVKIPLGVAFAAEAERLGIKHIHAHFAYVPADIARVMSIVRDGSYSVSAHAWDIYTQKPGILRVRLERAEFIPVCTEKGRAYLERTGQGCFAERLHLIRHGVPLQAPREGKDFDKGFVLAVGRLVEKKGMEFLVRSHRLLKDQGVKCRCEIVGDGPLRKRIEAQVRADGLTDTVSFRGELLSNEVTALLKEASLLVHSSIVTKAGDRDGLPNVVLEAMAMGIPVVATDASSAGEAVVDGVNGYIVSSGNENKLADRMKQLLTNDALREKMGAEGRKTIESRFDSDRCFADLLAAFQCEGSDV